MPYDTRELFARLIQCEAGGEGITGMMAVATVIMNRADATVGEFARVSQGGNVRNIILQENQFTCLKEVVGGVYNSQNIYNMSPTDEHFEIVGLGSQRRASFRRRGIAFLLQPQGRRLPRIFPDESGRHLQQDRRPLFLHPNRFL